MNTQQENRRYWCDVIFTIFFCLLAFGINAYFQIFHNELWQNNPQITIGSLALMFFGLAWSPWLAHKFFPTKKD
jgi:hypothetical protein